MRTARTRRKRVVFTLPEMVYEELTNFLEKFGYTGASDIWKLIKGHLIFEWSDFVYYTTKKAHRLSQMLVSPLVPIQLYLTEEEIQFLMRLDRVIYNKMGVLIKREDVLRLAFFWFRERKIGVVRDEKGR